MILCSNILKNNLSEEEFILFLEDLSGINAESKEGLLAKYKDTLDRLWMLNCAYEETDAALNYSTSKQFPLRMSLNEEVLGSLNGRIVDVSWRLLYSMSSKTVNKLYMPRFLITLKVLVDGFGVSGF